MPGREKQSAFEENCGRSSKNYKPTILKHPFNYNPETFPESTCYETTFCFETTDLLRDKSDDSKQVTVWEKVGFT
jgi:hypothetical protein